MLLFPPCFLIFHGIVSNMEGGRHCRRHKVMRRGKDRKVPTIARCHKNLGSLLPFSTSSIYVRFAILKNDLVLMEFGRRFSRSSPTPVFPHFILCINYYLLCLFMDLPHTRTLLFLLTSFVEVSFLSIDYSLSALWSICAFPHVSLHRTDQIQLSHVAHYTTHP